MKVLSMIQPWASLFILGESKFETRSWKTNYRGPLAIHTSKKIDKKASSHPNIQKLLNLKGQAPDTLPTGMIIGVCMLTDCLRVIDSRENEAVLADGRLVIGNEFFLGDYTVGNYAWEVSSMKQLDVFIPAKGQLGLWEYNGDISI